MATTVHATRKGPWVGALFVVLGLLVATPVGAQVVRFDPDSAEKRVQAVSEHLREGRFGSSARPVVEKFVSGQQLDRKSLSMRPGFLEGHLLPRMHRYMHDVASVHSLETGRVHFESSGIHDRFSYEVEQRAERAARKAARDYLYEITSFGSWIETLQIGHSIQTSAVVGGRRSATKVGFDVSHGIPKVGMRHVSGAGTARFVIGLDSSVRLDFYPTRWKVARFYAGFEPERSVYRLAYRLGF